jgi:predicted small secreted protein
MNTSLLIVILLCVMGFSSGCHSGTTRGVGSDISKLGNSMQK